MKRPVLPRGQNSIFSLFGGSTTEIEEAATEPKVAVPVSVEVDETIAPISTQEEIPVLQDEAQPVETNEHKESSDILEQLIDPITDVVEQATEELIDALAEVPEIANEESSEGQIEEFIETLDEFYREFVSDLDRVAEENTPVEAPSEPEPQESQNSEEAESPEELKETVHIVDIAPIAEVVREMRAMEAENTYAQAPETFTGLVSIADEPAPDSEFMDPASPVIRPGLTFSSAIDVQDISGRPSVTFHKHKKVFRIKADDYLAANICEDITGRLKNELMQNMEYFDSAHDRQTIPSGAEFYELWRWVEPGLESHPLFQILKTYGVDAQIAPSLAGYMRRQKKRVALMKAPYPCYESSPDDISETIVNGMFLTFRGVQAADGEDSPDSLPERLRYFKSGSRYMVKSVAEDGTIQVLTQQLTGRSLLSEDGHFSNIYKSDIKEYFEDADKFTVEASVRDLYPDRINQIEARLSALPIGQEERLFKHSWEDVPAEALKGDVLISKSMRMGKSREAIAICEARGTKKIGWIGPPMANMDIPREFREAEVYDFKEIESILDLEDPAKYHIMTYEFIKGDYDPLRGTRRGNKEKTWLRLMGMGKHIADCPHCDQPLERPIKIKAVDGRILRVSWTLYNGYLCRNPYCIWTEVQNDRRRRKAKSVPQFRNKKIFETDSEYAQLLHAHVLKHREEAATPWHSVRESKAITHQGGYIDWERMRHSECGDHVGRKRVCPKCGVVDSTWRPAIYKRIKKNYATVVLDEIHLTKDESSHTAKSALDMRGRHHIGNSGTPMSKDLVDMFPQFMWIYKTKSVYFPYDRVTGKREYKERFCENARIQRAGTDRVHYKTLPYARNPPDFWNFSAPLIVRRTRADKVYLESLDKIGLKLPSEATYVMPVQMVAPQALLLSHSIDKFRDDFSDYCDELEEQGKSLNSHIVMTMMSRMKIAATIPGFLNRPDQPVIYDGGDLDPYGIGGKGIALSTLVPAKISEGKKVVIMSQFVMMREQLQKKFAHLNPVVLPSGTSSVRKKREALRPFREDPNRSLLLCGGKQISMGVELNCADVLINTDLMWEAGTQQQALARLMGPTMWDRLVELYILNSEHSIDGHIYNVFYGKIAGMEQALDKRVISRSVQSVNWVSFADTVVAQQTALQSYFRDEPRPEGIVLPDLDLFDDELMLRSA